MNDSQFPQAKRRGSIARVVLVASLALNLAIVGLVIGATLRSEEGSRRSSETERARALQSRDFGLGPLVGALDDDARRIVGQSFIRRVDSSDDARAGVRRKMQHTLTLLAADPFDADLFRESITEQQAKFAERQTLGLTVLTDYLVEMTDEERMLYAERLKEVIERPRAGPDGEPREQRGRPPRPRQEGSPAQER